MRERLYYDKYTYCLIFYIFCFKLLGQQELIGKERTFVSTLVVTINLIVSNYILKVSLALSIVH